MKTLSLRRWLILTLLALFVVPALLFNLTAPLLGAVPWFSSHQSSATLDQAAALLATPADWRDPAWQHRTAERLATLRVDARILDPGGNLIYQNRELSTGGPPWRRSGSWNGSPSREIQVIEGNQPLGTVELYDTGGWQGGFPGAALAALLGLALTLLAAGWLIGRYVVRPLEATGRAARRIAAGELDFTVPDSRVREVAEMRAAFQAMGDGLRQSLERQAELEEERRFFVGAIAHDLRTPLFSLRGYLQGLEQGIAATPEKAARYVAVCREKADQLDRLVSDLFAYTRVEYLEETLRFEAFPFGRLLRSVVEELQPRAQAKGVALVPRDGGDCPVHADRHLLQRAVENLVDNGLRHTPPGGAIEVAWSCDGPRVRFSVADSGPGIAPDDLAHLFDPLYRGERSRNPETGGLGLGLTIARRILRAHGGDLTAGNRPGGGAEFSGWLVGTTDTPGAADTEVKDRVKSR